MLLRRKSKGREEWQMPRMSSLRSRSRPRILNAKPDKALLFLARLASDLAAVHTLPGLLERVMLALYEETGFDSCALALLDERDPHTLTIRAASGLRAKSQGLTLPRDKGLYGAVMDKRTPLLISNMSLDPRVDRREPKIKSGIYAPLVVNDRAVGVLSAYGSEPEAFTEADLSLLTVVARYLTGAIEVARLNEQLKELAATDALTGLANRRSFLDRLASEIARSRRTGRELSVVLLDLDGFESINDVHGHATGDELLIHVAHVLVRNIRASDVAARWGGDEFGVLLPETAEARAEKAIARLRAVGITIPHQREAGSYVSLSYGLATWPKDAQTPEGLLREADSRLYKMKRRPLRKGARGLVGDAEPARANGSQGQFRAAARRKVS